VAGLLFWKNVQTEKVSVEEDRGEGHVEGLEREKARELTVGSLESFCMQAAIPEWLEIEAFSFVWIYNYTQKCVDLARP